MYKRPGMHQKVITNATSDTILIKKFKSAESMHENGYPVITSPGYNERIWPVPSCLL